MTMTARAKKIAKLSDEAKREAERLGLTKDPVALAYAASHDTAQLQVKALRSEAARKLAKAQRRAAGVSVSARVVPFVDRRRVVAREFLQWLIETCGQKEAIAIVCRMADLDPAILFDEVGRIQRANGRASA